MKLLAIFLALMSGLFLVAIFCSRQSPAQAPSIKPTLPQPLTQIVFEPDLKVNGSILSGTITCYTARNRHATTEITVQSLVVKTNRAITPFPQYEIEDIPKLGSNGHIFPNSERPLPLGKTQHIFGKTDLEEYLSDGNIRSVRLRVVVMEGKNDPKNWITPTSIVRFSPWTPYKSRVKLRVTPTSATAH